LRQAFDVAARHRIVIDSEDDDRHGGSRCGRRHQRELGTVREQDVRLGCDQLVSTREGVGYALVDAAKFDDKISALGESELAQFFKQGGISNPRARAIAGRPEDA
jgi:hypothetical protein